MKFLCPHCERLTALEDFELDGATLVIRCTACTKASRVEARAAPTVAAAAVEPLPVPATAADSLPPPAGLSLVRPVDAAGLDGAVPEGFCPKCIAPRADQATTCRQCGLVFDNFNPAHFELSPELSALWGAARGAGKEDAPFRHLLAMAHQRGELALLGRLYRIRLARDPHDAVAKHGRDEVVRLASTAGALTPDPQASPALAKERGRKVLAVALVFLVFILFYMARVVLRMSAR